MSHDFDAIYDNGVFRPLQPLVIPDGTRVHLHVDESRGPHDDSTAAADAATLRRQEDALAKLRTEMDALPSEAPQDGLGGRDHDHILYGWQK
jgi:predicted DNA-binding antitoxin AbrB/MazE fold protein